MTPSDKALRSKLIRLASVSSPADRKAILAVLKEAGCEKLPEGGMPRKASFLGIDKIQNGHRNTFQAGAVYAHVWFDADVARTDAGNRAPSSGEWQVIISDSPDPLNQNPRGRELARDEFRFVEKKTRESVLYAAEGFIRDQLRRQQQRLAVLKDAGCEKLPNQGMIDNCEKKKEEGKKNDKTAAQWGSRTLSQAFGMQVSLDPAPDGVHAFQYAVRHGDNARIPVAVEKFVRVNFFCNLYCERTLTFPAGKDFLNLDANQQKALANAKRMYITPNLRTPRLTKQQRDDFDMRSRAREDLFKKDPKAWAAKYNLDSDGNSPSMKAGAKTAKLMSRQEAILKKYIASNNKPASDYDDLPSSVQDALTAVKDQETLWSDVNRWLGDNLPSPHLRAATTGKTADNHSFVLQTIPMGESAYGGNNEIEVELRYMKGGATMNGMMPRGYWIVVSLQTVKGVMTTSYPMRGSRSFLIAAKAFSPQAFAKAVAFAKVDPGAQDTIAAMVAKATFTA